jgi:hypothetical protein
MAGYAQGMQQFGNAGPAMGRIQSLNNFNQQFGGRNILGAGQRPAQPMQPQMGQQPFLSNGWFGNMLGQAQRYLGRI